MNDEAVVQRVLSVSKEIQSVLNDYFLDQFAKLHGIRPEFNRFNAKQEVVARKAYFLNVKKKYVLYIINMEGVPVDEFDIKGIAIKRSDYPSLTRQKLEELLDLLLKVDRVSFIKLKKFIDDTRTEMINLIEQGQRIVARPVNFTKDLDSYKTIPSHVRGMLLWNEVEYDYFVPGTRGYLFRIKGIDTYRVPDRLKPRADMLQKKARETKWICLPYEEGTLPDYYIIDVDNMIKFAWDDRISEFLEPLMGNMNIQKKITQQSTMTW